MNNPDVNTTALLRLADKLVGEGEYKNIGPVPEENFDMGKWKCGTNACACGHAGSDQWFIDRGFSLRMDAYGDEYEPTCRTWDSNTFEYVTLTSWEAISKFFRIDEDAAENLFSYNTHITTREQVAANIRQFVKLWKDAKAKEVLDGLWKNYTF